MTETIAVDPDFPMPGWTQGEHSQPKFSRTTRSRKTIKELKGDEDLPIRTTAGRTNIDLDQVHAAEQSKRSWETLKQRICDAAALAFPDYNSTAARIGTRFLCNLGGFLEVSDKGTRR
ncbi:hypothetical protein GGR51DRAFT_555151 [Nemania sp. FL0031]|nr:hypothetical protein GGR51DRAFT_555151 [Nemania sp. FL0031]